MRSLPPLCLVLLGTLGLLVSSVPTADAHALLRQSNPEDGAELQHAPEAVTLTFTEDPEAEFSVIQVLDTSGQLVPGVGRVQTVPGQPFALRIAVGPLLKGVYTVTWRVVSRVDGHVTGGTYAFGIGVPPTEAPSAGMSTPVGSPLAIPGKWAFYAGLMALLGSAWVWTIGTRKLPPGAFRFLWLAWLASTVGLVALAEAQRVDAGVGWAKLLGSFLGRALLLRALPLFVAGLGIVAARVRDLRGRRIAFTAVGISAAAVILVHVAAGHAGASAGSWRWAKIVFQWAHFVGVGVWMGGLAALLIAVRGAPDDQKAAAVQRFSTGAAIALGVVAVTGVLRAVDEVGAWGLLATTTFGQFVLLKSGLLVVLALLGAVNRYRSVPAARASLRGLRRVGATELAIAGLVLGVTGLLTGQAPPSAVQAAKAPPPLLVSGSDFATSVRAQLEIAPGTPGSNQFVARVVDYDTAQPVAADRISLRFTLKGRPGIPPSTLALTRASDGTFRGKGSNLSLNGQWNVVLTVEHGINSVEVLLMVTMRSQPQQVRMIRAPGQPTLYVIELPDKRSVQVYLDPERPGATQVHATYFDAEGRELPIASNPTMTATLERKAVVTLPVRRFGPGHFIADAQLSSGAWQFEIDATGPHSEELQSRLIVRL